MVLKTRLPGDSVPDEANREHSFPVCSTQYYTENAAKATFSRRPTHCIMLVINDLRINSDQTVSKFRVISRHLNVKRAPNGRLFVKFAAGRPKTRASSASCARQILGNSEFQRELRKTGGLTQRSPSGFVNSMPTRIPAGKCSSKKSSGAFVPIIRVILSECRISAASPAMLEFPFLTEALAAVAHCHSLGPAEPSQP